MPNDLKDWTFNCFTHTYEWAGYRITVLRNPEEWASSYETEGDFAEHLSLGIHATPATAIIACKKLRELLIAVRWYTIKWLHRATKGE